MTKDMDDTVLTFLSEDDEEIRLVVLERTKINGINYLLAVEESEDDTQEEEALILKEISEETAEEAVYDVVDDDTELKLISAVFAELLEDVEII